jgi:hypothetical protein
MEVWNCKEERNVAVVGGNKRIIEAPYLPNICKRSVLVLIVATIFRVGLRLQARLTSGWAEAAQVRLRSHSIYE